MRGNDTIAAMSEITIIRTADALAEFADAAARVGWVALDTEFLRERTYSPELCLVQVLVVQRLLAKRNIPGQFYLGVRRGVEDNKPKSSMAAHAWLQCDEDIVNGAAGHEHFAVVCAFSWGPVSD